MKYTELRKGIDTQNNCFTISVKINNVYFESVAYSETERDTIYNNLEADIAASQE